LYREMAPSSPGSIRRKWSMRPSFMDDIVLSAAGSTFVRELKCLMPAHWIRTCSLAFVAVVLPRCTESDPPPLGSYERQEGAGCGYADAVCEGGEELWLCVDRRWSRLDCAVACADHGGAVGCEAADGDDGDHCRCEDESACEFAEDTCLSDDVLGVCDPASLRVVEHACEEVCESLSPPQISTGCARLSQQDVCTCTTLGAACEEGSISRCDAFGLLVCADGNWEWQDCADVCDVGTCDPWAPGGPACICGDS
jgi:hypothetical protein